MAVDYKTVSAAVVIIITIIYLVFHTFLIGSQVYFEINVVNTIMALDDKMVTAAVVINIIIIIYLFFTHSLIGSQVYFHVLDKNCTWETTFPAPFLCAHSTHSVTDYLHLKRNDS
jgi:hypothetical protein